MKYFSLYCLLFFSCFIFSADAQNLIAPDSVVFEQQQVGISSNATIKILNKSFITNFLVKHSNKNFNLDSTITINRGDSVEITISYKPDQNVFDYDFVKVYSEDSSASVVIRVIGSGKYNDSYDNTTFNLYDTQLKTALNTLVINHTSLGYNIARDSMFVSVDDYGGDTIECVYTGLKIHAVNRTEAQNLGFNTEHTWPQSNFSQNEPMRSDLFHLYPTDDTPNNKRSNYPFGNVVNASWQSNGSKLGSDSTGATIFEPRDVHKGNVSRSMYYFIIRYPSNYGNFFDIKQEKTFRSWNRIDPVDAREMLRNNRIASIQGKRNPFIDHPEFVDRIYSFITNNNTPLVMKCEILPSKISYDSTSVTDTSFSYIYLFNNGNNGLQVQSISISDPHFVINDTLTILSKKSLKKLRVNFIPDADSVYNASVVINTDLGAYTCLLKGIGAGGTIGVKDEVVKPNSFILYNNYPNPFNPSTNIKFYNNRVQDIVLNVYDILGNLVQHNVMNNVNVGDHSYTFNGQKLSSGVYIYQVITPNNIISKQMLLLK